MGGEDKLSLLRSSNCKGAGVVAEKGYWEPPPQTPEPTRYSQLQEHSRYQRKSSRLEVKNRAKDRGKDGWSKI